MDDRHAAPPFLIGPHRACAAHLQAISPRVVGNWVLRVVNMPVFRADPGLDLGRLLGRISALVPAIIASLVVSDLVLEDEPGLLVEAIAAEHGRSRRRLGTSIGTLLIEFQELHRLLGAAAEEWSALHGDARSRRVLAERLACSLDRAQVAAAEAWTGAGADLAHAKAS